MTGHDFLTVADDLAAGTTEAAWRSAISRAYYAAFHVAREFLIRLGFRVATGDRAHAYLWLRLSNTKDPVADACGQLLQDLRSRRNTADYDLSRPCNQKLAQDAARDALDVIQDLDGLTGTPTEIAIRDAIRVYEQNVLKVVTWTP
jgi:uncharacterized protein (UPF0332 family)